MTASTEEWRPVPGWPQYEVSDQLRVRHTAVSAAASVKLVAENGRPTRYTVKKLYQAAFHDQPLVARKYRRKK